MPLTEKQKATLKNQCDALTQEIQKIANNNTLELDNKKAAIEKELANFIAKLRKEGGENVDTLVRKAYHELAKTLHPDKNSDLKACDAFVTLNKLIEQKVSFESLEDSGNKEMKTYSIPEGKTLEELIREFKALEADYNKNHNIASDKSGFSCETVGNVTILRFPDQASMDKFIANMLDKGLIVENKPALGAHAAALPDWTQQRTALPQEKMPAGNAAAAKQDPTSRPGM